MMEYEVASVEDRGTYWEVLNVLKSTFETEDRGEKYLRLSHITYKKIEKAMRSGRRVTIRKPLETVEVLPGSLEIIDVDPGDLKNIRDYNLRRARMIVTPELASISGLAMYGFICLNNELAEKGFFITDENRESMYLKILETGDEKLIAKLEDYLNYRDEIGRVAALHDKFEQFRKDINNSESEEEITGITDRFLEDFYSRY